MIDLPHSDKQIFVRVMLSLCGRFAFGILALSGALRQLSRRESL